MNITVEDMVYDLSAGPLYLLKNEEMVSLEPTSTLSGAVYEISPDLPSGLFFGQNNGTIWGTPTVTIPLDTFTIYANSSLLNDVIEIQIGVLEDTDLDGSPDQLPVDYNPLGGLSEDLDDDGDGFTDVEEGNCVSDSLDATSIPSDLDGDLTCDALDDDIDGDGLLNDVETNTSTYVDENDTGTDSMNADSDGDGVCDGPQVPANGGCTAGPDVFPFDPAGSIDTDGDGICDENEVEGCTDATAANYDGSATDEDGSCEYPNLGCTDQFACNYDAEATEDNGACEYPASFAVDCNGNCLIDTDCDGVCNQDEILG